MQKENISHQTISLLAYENEARSSIRLNLQIPLFVRARDAEGESFLELAKTLNISATGTLVASPRPLNPGLLVTLTVPAPSLTTSALLPAGMPPIHGKVTRQQEVGDVFVIGVEFTTPIG
jgi:hypothetical protein